MPNPTIAPRVLLRSEQTADRLAVIDIVVPGSWEGPPLHHHAFDETFYVLEGELTFALGGELHTRRAGELAFAPRDEPHTLANFTGRPARYLLVCTPAGFERYFDRMLPEPPATASGPYQETIVVGPTIPGGAIP
jgi:mannose-6-phosphate isomerase-like protein (cupin superfamily)